jgi:hypothetical protein
MSGVSVRQLLLDAGARLGLPGEARLDVGEESGGDRAIARRAIVCQLPCGRAVGKLTFERVAGLLEIRACLAFFGEARRDRREALGGGLLVARRPAVRQLARRECVGQLLLERGARLFERAARLGFLRETRFDVRELLRDGCECRG